LNLFKKEKTKEIVAVQKREISTPITDDLLNKFMKTMGIGTQLLPYEMEAYKEMAKMYQLNPFKREIHVVAYGKGEYRTLAITVGYETYLKKAEESGLMEYWDIETASAETPIEKYWATLVVKRKDRSRVQKWTVHYTEAFQTKKDGTPNKFWVKQPRMMTRKTAMSQCFRLFFEDVLHGIPYTIDEMPDHDERDVTPEDPKPIKQETRSDHELPQKPFSKPFSKSKPPAQTVMDAEGLPEHQNQSAPILPSEFEERAAEEPQTPKINYFHEIIALVNKSKLPPMSNDQYPKGKMDYIKSAKEHMNDQNLLKDLFNDLVRDTSNG